VMQWSGKEMDSLMRGIVPGFASTLWNLSTSQRIPFKEALLYVKISVYFHLISEYLCYTEVTIAHRENYLEELIRHKNVYSAFRTSQSSKKVLEAFQKKQTLNKQEERDSDPPSTIFLRLHSVIIWT
jgi:hypothetical protein